MERLEKPLPKCSQPKAPKAYITYSQAKAYAYAYAYATKKAASFRSRLWIVQVLAFKNYTCPATFFSSSTGSGESPTVFINHSRAGDAMKIEL